MVLCMRSHDFPEKIMKDALNASFEGLWIAEYIHWVEKHHDWWNNGIVFSPLVGGSDIRQRLIKKEYIVIKHKGNSFVIFCNTSEGAKYKIKDRDFWEDLESFKETPDYLSLVNSDVDGHADVEELPVKVEQTVPTEKDFPSLPVQETPTKAWAKVVEQAAPAKASAKAAEQAAEQATQDIPCMFAIYINGEYVEIFHTREEARASFIKNKPAWDLVPSIRDVVIRGLIVGPVVE